ncbi:MAG: family 43 glycosylhydrolase [Chloroflexaceae bacterium]|nr:family 43 glycosylhydrolase [Chloroflexaceae bacterium]
MAGGFLVLVLLVVLMPRVAWQQDPYALLPCYDPWSPPDPDTRVKDHTLFAYQDAFYLVTMVETTKPGGQGGQNESDERDSKMLAGARTEDFCTWEYLGVVLSLGDTGEADEAALWAPYVVQESETTYLFYTGVNRHLSQSIMLATSTDPGDPQNWVRRGVVFRPHHDGMIYAGTESWSDARDPMVLSYQGRYYLYYTGRDVDGGIVGVAMAETLDGPWQDLGAVLRTPHDIMPESPFVVEAHGFFYLFYNAAHIGERWQWGPSPFGPWQPPPTEEETGWAYDFLFTGVTWLASYVIGDGQRIGFAPVSWDTSCTPPRPLAPQEVAQKVFLPMIVRE